MAGHSELSGLQACFSQNVQRDFNAGESLKAIIMDWSDAQVKGLKAAIGESQASALIKGCKVHWLRSCQRVADKVTSNCNAEKEMFLKIAQKTVSLQCS